MPTEIVPGDIVPGEMLTTLRGVALPDGETATIDIADGRIAAVRRGSQANRPVSGTEASAADVSGTDARAVDAAGWMLLPPLADLHAHVDKAYTWSVAGEPEGSLEDAIACWITFGETIDQSTIAANARRQLMAALQSGVLTVRTHVNYHQGPDPLRGIRAVAALKAEFADLVDLQIVAMHSEDRDDALVRDAIALGADLVGSAPHLASDPRAEIDRTARLAEEAGIGVDMHTDETLNPHSLDLIDLAARTRDWPAHMTRSAGHCVSLAVQPPDRLAAALDAAAEARVSIIANPITNLYLQGWEHPVATPRAIPPLKAILSAGVELAAGGDNVQDPFNPLGSGDMVEVAASLVIAGHLTPREAWRVAAAGRPIMGLAAAGTAVGDPADGILVRAASVAEALAERAPARVVLRAGRVVATRHVSAATVSTRKDVPV